MIGPLGVYTPESYQQHWIAQLYDGCRSLVQLAAVGGAIWYAWHGRYDAALAWAIISLAAGNVAVYGVSSGRAGIRHDRHVYTQNTIAIEGAA